MRLKHTSLPALLLALALLLTACQDGGESPQESGQAEEPSFAVTAALQDETGATLTHHLYENLMRWADGGDGFAVLAPGQAESYTVETDYAGCATYTFTLRDNIQWSDGRAVTAEDFAAAWRRLADPASSALPGHDRISLISGFDQVQETGDTSLLAVSAPDQRTFVVTLSGPGPLFLEELCASADTMPLRTDLLTSGGEMTGTVTNGPYVLQQAGSAVLVRSETYYDAKSVGPDELRFVALTGSQPDYEKLLSGQLDLLQGLPAQRLQELADSGSWLPDPVSSVYGVLFNTQTPPFDSAEVRQAFRLAVDEAAVAEALADLTLRPAVGLIPYGVDDHSAQRPDSGEAAEEDPVLPDPNAPEPAEEPAVYWDFRTHSQALVTQTEESDYAADCLRAKALMAQAGYASGGGFPVVEYLYVSSDANRAAAQALQSMWREQLGVTVTLRGVTREEYDAVLHPDTEADEGSSGEESGENTAAFNMAAQDFTALFNDAESLLRRWHSASAENAAGYHSDAFDILMDSAAGAIAPEAADARDAYLHDAEAILLSDAAVIPLYFRGTSFQLSDSLTGLYRAPNGLCFLSALRPADGAAS